MRFVLRQDMAYDQRVSVVMMRMVIDRYVLWFENTPFDHMGMLTATGSVLRL